MMSHASGTRSNGMTSHAFEAPSSSTVARLLDRTHVFTAQGTVVCLRAAVTAQLECCWSHIGLFCWTGRWEAWVPPFFLICAS
ncbi:hypothetical protein AMECASPLE_014119, partial [Ameca splendens]